MIGYTELCCLENSNWCTFLVPLCLIMFFMLLVATIFLWKKTSSVPVAYADCMVHTYLYGYLRKVVPDHGEKDGGLKDRIQLYKACHNFSDENFPFNKMFIVIPSSGYIPPNLNKLDERIERREHEVNPKVISRAGVKDRIYKSSIYKIKFRGKQEHFTVVMEGAPPTIVLYDACKENKDLEKHKTQLIRLFYEKLLAVIKQDKTFEDACELIYFDEESGTSLADLLVNKYLKVF